MSKPKCKGGWSSSSGGETVCFGPVFLVVSVNEEVICAQMTRIDFQVVSLWWCGLFNEVSASNIKDDEVMMQSDVCLVGFS